MVRFTDAADLELDVGRVTGLLTFFSPGVTSSLMSQGSTVLFSGFTRCYSGRGHYDDVHKYTLDSGLTVSFYFVEM
jgi:hypothetical protein